MAALFPAVNQFGGISNNYFAAASLEQNRDNVDIKINYVPSDKASVFGRYSLEPTYVFDPQALGAAGGSALGGGQPGTAPGLTQSAALGGSYTFTPHLFLDGNVGFTRQRLGAENVDLGKNYGLDVLGIPGTNGPEYLQSGYPYFSVTGFSSFGNPNVSNPFRFRDNEYLFAANLSWDEGISLLPLRRGREPVPDQSLSGPDQIRRAGRLRFHRRPDGIERRLGSEPVQRLGRLHAGPAAGLWAKTTSTSIRPR